MHFRVLGLALLCLFMLKSVRGLELGLESRELSLADIPSCGLSCMLSSIPNSTCELDNIQCQCENSALAMTVSNCMLAHCTMNDTLSLAKVQADMCHRPNVSKTHEVMLYTTVCYPVAIFFVLLRLASRLIAKRIRMDDWIIFASLLITVLPMTCVYMLTSIGFGEHLWNLQPGKLLENLRLFYIAWSTYCIVLGMIKSSLVLFYLEIFPSRQDRIVAYIILAWIVVTSLVIFFLSVFSCTPIEAFWDRDTKGKCLDITSLAFVNSGFAIAQDIALLIYPLFCVRQLKMELYRKVAVALMFAIGTLGCVATILRLQSLMAFKITIDPTWDYVQVTIWTEIEIACGYICVSLPAIRVLLNKMFPKTIFTSVNRTRNTTNANTLTNGSTNPGTPAEGIKKRHSIWFRFSDANARRTSVWPSGWTSRPWSGASPSATKSHRRLGSDHDIELYPSSHMYKNYTQVTTFPRSVAQQPRQPKDEIEAGWKGGNKTGHPTTLSRIGCLPDVEYPGPGSKRPTPASPGWL